MSTRQVATTGITLALGFILGALAWQPSFAQRKAEEPAKVEQQVAGRYGVAAAGTSGGGLHVVVCETATGNCWVHRNGMWTDYGSPVPAKK